MIHLAYPLNHARENTSQHSSVRTGRVFILALTFILTVLFAVGGIILDKSAVCCCLGNAGQSGLFSVYVTALASLRIFAMIVTISLYVRALLRPSRVEDVNTSREGSYVIRFGLYGNLGVACLFGLPFTVSYLCLLVFPSHNIEMLNVSEGFLALYCLCLAALPDLPNLFGRQPATADVIDPQRDGTTSAANIHIGHELRLVAEYSPRKMDQGHPSTATQGTSLVNPTVQDQQKGNDLARANRAMESNLRGQESPAQWSNKRLSQISNDSDASLLIVQSLRRLTHVQRPSVLPLRASNPTPLRARAPSLLPISGELY